MKKKLFFACVASATLLMSCGGGTGTNNAGADGDAPKEKTFADVSYDIARELDSTYNYDGKEIELEGKFNIRLVSMIRNNMFDVSFDTESGNQTEDVSPVNVAFGKTKNSLYFPDKAQNHQIEIYDQNGEQLSYRKPVKIKAKVTYTDKGPKKKRSEEKGLNEGIRKMYKDQEAREAAKGGDGMDYSYRLTNVTITKIDSIK